VTPPRILYVPNEFGNFRQVGFRRPLANLQAAGLVTEVSVLSLLWRIREGGDPEMHRKALIQRVARFQPNVILMQHVGSTGLRAKHFDQMRAASHFKLIYHEADPYQGPLHPLPRSAALAGQAADVVFTVGSGRFAKAFRMSGARDVRWESHAFDVERYREIGGDPPATRQHDIVIVANRNRPRMRGLPNWRDRIRFVRYLQERFGDRLAIYGAGWEGAGVMGPIPFAEQHVAIRSGWISANWDHFAREPNYFSNRLPISLAAGSIHATTWHPGYDEIFARDTREFLLLSRSQVKLADAIEEKLAGTDSDQRLAAVRHAQTYSYRRFRQDDQMVRFLNFERQIIDPACARDSWDLDSTPLEET
jgi:hypothetical protein